jgi:hypothetical protein
LADSADEIKGWIHDTGNAVRAEMGDSTNARMTKAATGNTETGITVTYQSGDSTIDYVVDTGTIATKGHAENYADSVESRIRDTINVITDLDSANVTDGSISLDDIHQHGATTNQVPKWDGSHWNPADDSVGLASDAGDFNLYGQLGRNNYKEVCCTTEVFCDNASEHWDYLCNYGVSNGGPSDSGLFTDTSYFGVHPSALYFAKGYGCSDGDSIYAYDTAASPDTLCVGWAKKDEKRRYIMAWTPLPVMPYEV